MKRLKQFDTLVVDDFEEAVYSTPVHTHTYYEIVYIHKGCGTHHLNHVSIAYKAGDLFLLQPGDTHIFDIKKSTRFSFIKFTESYFQQHQHCLPAHFRMYNPLAIMQLNEIKENKPDIAEPYKTILRNTVENIVACRRNKDRSTSAVICYQILSILAIVQESLPHLQTGNATAQPDKEAVTTYIHQHIYNREKLRIPVVAAHFHIAPSYFSSYFKNNFGISYRAYTGQYRLKLIENRLLASRVTLKQIAEEFDYTDESHLIRSFRKLTGANPSEFKKSAVL
jgi:YesN/AraC family two-component response regulator